MSTPEDSNWKQLTLPFAHDAVLLAAGAESKGAFACVTPSGLHLSRNFGSLLEPDNWRSWLAAVDEAMGVFGRPAAVAADLHPGYMTTQWAHRLGAPVVSVQHHHAHVAACLAEHGVQRPVLGLVCDGAGCGDDKASWGCELLAVDGGGYRRLGHLREIGLPGGDAAAVEAWRAALGWVAELEDAESIIAEEFGGVPAGSLAGARRMLSRGLQCPRTTSLGRLFDAAAYLLGVGERNDEEAQLARGLEAAAGERPGRAAPVDIQKMAAGEVWDIRPALAHLLKEKTLGASVEQLAADFHETVAVMLADAVVAAARESSVTDVAFSGGCFLNRRLSDTIYKRLAEAGLSVLRHGRVSTGDPGLPVGQAAVAVWRSQ